MKYRASPIPGLMLLELDQIQDQRGFFARIFCREELENEGVRFNPVQANLSGNHRQGTLRGLHYQAPPFEEAKLVRAVAGEIFDVVLDLRPDSPAYGQWYGTRLSAANRLALYIPEGCAHGYQTLADNSEVLYLVSQAYVPEAGRGLRWNDPFPGIEWPINPPLVISDQDRSWPDYPGRSPGGAGRSAPRAGF